MGEKDWLQQAEEDLEIYRKEQACIDQKLAELRMQSHRRREKFKAVWGVSPRCINQKRSTKNVINLEKITFSPVAPKSQSEGNSDMDDNLSDTRSIHAINFNDINKNKYSVDDCKNIYLKTSSMPAYNCSSQPELKSANAERKYQKLVRFANVTSKEDIQVDYASVTINDQTREQTKSNSAFPKNKPNRRSSIHVKFRSILEQGRKETYLSMDQGCALIEELRVARSSQLM